MPFRRTRNISHRPAPTRPSASGKLRQARSDSSLQAAISLVNSLRSPRPARSSPGVARRGRFVFGTWIRENCCANFRDCRRARQGWRFHPTESCWHLARWMEPFAFGILMRASRFAAGWPMCGALPALPFLQTARCLSRLGVGTKLSGSGILRPERRSIRWTVIREWCGGFDSRLTVNR